MTAPGWKDITSRHFAALAALARNQAGSRLDLPCGLAAEKTYETLRIFRKNTNEKNAEKGKRISLERRYITADGTLCLELEIPEERIQICTLSREKAGEIPKNQYTKWFDYDKMCIRDRVMIQSQIASEQGLFTVEDVIDGLCEKMIRRHPHVFGDAVAATPEESLDLWNEIKKQEKAKKT